MTLLPSEEYQLRNDFDPEIFQIFQIDHTPLFLPTLDFQESLLPLDSPKSEASVPTMDIFSENTADQDKLSSRKSKSKALYPDGREWYESREGNKKYFHCPYPECDKKFVKSANHLHSHYLTHFGIKQFKCQVCSLDFTRQHDRDRHMKQRHLGSRPYSCSKCSKKFTKKVTWQNHHCNHNVMSPPLTPAVPIDLPKGNVNVSCFDDFFNF